MCFFIENVDFFQLLDKRCNNFVKIFDKLFVKIRQAQKLNNVIKRFKFRLYSNSFYFIFLHLHVSKRYTIF